MEFRHKFLGNLVQSFVLSTFSTFMMFMAAQIDNINTVLVIWFIMFYWHIQDYRQTEVNNQLSDKIKSLEKQLAKK